MNPLLRNTARTFTSSSFVQPQFTSNVDEQMHSHAVFKSKYGSPTFILYQTILQN